MKSPLLAASVFAAVAFAAQPALAVPELCSVLPDPSTNQDGLSTSDATFRTFAADDCYGVVNDNNDLTLVNTGTTYFGGNWDIEVKDDPPGSGDTQTYLGFEWTLLASGPTPSGTWTLTVSDPDPANPPDYPVTIDIMLVLKGSNNFAAYFFDDETFTLDGSNPGTFSIVFNANPAGQFPNLSHLSAYFREGTPTSTGPGPGPGPGTGPGPGGSTPAGGTAVPEPASLMLLGSGLALAATRMRRRQK